VAVSDDFESYAAGPEVSRELPEAAAATDLMEMLARGATVTFLANFFGQAKEHIAAKMAGAKVVGRTKHGTPAYDFKEACSRLARPSPDQVIEYVKKMRPNDLPPIMQKEFWDAALKRQKWEREAGELWRTEEITEAMAEVFKSLRMTIMLFSDTVARETGITNKQREIITALSDQLLEDLRESLIENPAFEKYRTEGAKGAEQFGTEFPEVDEPDPETVHAAESDRKSRRRVKAAGAADRQRGG
jgi:hypothetical protein